jgi:hypothetical protein
MNEPKPRPTLEQLTQETQDLNSKSGIGLTCPKCGCRDTKVITTWHDSDGSETKRTRVCRACGTKLSTREIIF